jgi:hypothetical protein
MLTFPDHRNYRTTDHQIYEIVEKGPIGMNTIVRFRHLPADMNALNREQIEFPPFKPPNELAHQMPGDPFWLYHNKCALYVFGCGCHCDIPQY